jgi:hypothetical protein
MLRKERKVLNSDNAFAAFAFPITIGSLRPLRLNWILLAKDQRNQVDGGFIKLLFK